MGCSHSTTSKELNLHKERINWVRGRVGGHSEADSCFGPLKTREMVSLEGTQQTLSSTFLTNPLAALREIFPFRSLLGQTLLFATNLCSGKRTIEKCNASSCQQLPCGKASLSAQLWQFRKNPGSQGTWVRGTPGRETHEPRVSVFTFYLLPFLTPQLPLPAPISAQTLRISTNGWWWCW